MTPKPAGHLTVNMGDDHGTSPLRFEAVATYETYIRSNFQFILCNALDLCTGFSNSLECA